ncbi:tripartite tricarboxylate transporter TctB family protein [Vallitalea pronyensis]|uniref:Tripartite tricarboxylate transporter TctB family protein n=1 Tax=Vallitalea pronyensis TaxID=1348613 RepID=A0A8J8SGC7_9FIRM|nr:tripartite tricarboxylate transporter TctB family protein [Vallitalea pronyensis]QUI22259.1 tripartite tricarboxylate transporter TctB family protein [Vallitalea pronyensis]
MGEIIFMGILAVISFIMLIMTYNFPTSIIDQSGGAALFPRIVIFLLLFFMIIRVVEIIRKKEWHKKFAFFEMFKGIRLVYLLSTLAFILSIKYVGYIVSTSIYLIVTIIYFYKKEMGEKQSKKKLAVTIVLNIMLVIGVYYVFTDVLNILLPEGIMRR